MHIGNITEFQQSGTPAAPHPFLSHPWCERDSDSGIPWGVLATPSITHLRQVVREQDFEDEIRCPRYLINATGEGAARLCQDPEDPLSLRQPIFLNRDDDIRVWFLTNSGHISKKNVYSRRIGPASGRRASPPFDPYVLNVRLCVLCVLVTCVHVPVTVHRSGQCRISYV